jgi:hypothetical protein
MSGPCRRIDRDLGSPARYGRRLSRSSAGQSGPAISEATAALDAAEHTFGSTSVLAAARSHIASGAPFLSAPDVSLYVDLV